MQQRIFLILIFFTIPGWLPAAHLKGGYIEYQYIGPSPDLPNYKRFAITVFQYMDCHSSGGQIDENVFLGVFNAVTNSPISTNIIPLANTRFIQKKQFDCIDNPPVICYRIDSYNVISDLPDTNDGIILSVQRCCRIAGINNVSNSSNSGIAYSVKLFPSLTGNGLLINNSPVFSQADTALVCAKNGFTYPFKALDEDGDLLVYKFTSGINTTIREAKPFPPLAPPYPNLTYSGNYSSSQPMGIKVRIDSNTGIISGIAPDLAGDYVVAVNVEEYRDGIKIAETRKEIHISVGNCHIPKAFLPESIINCNDFQVTFENQSYAAGVNSFNWFFGVPGSHSDTSQEVRPVFVYPDTGTYIAKLVINRDGICPDSTETIVKIYPGFQVNFAKAGICAQAPFSFKDLSLSNYGVINKWHWDFGDFTSSIDSSNLQNPAYLYGETGSYLVKLVAESSKGCIDSTLREINVSNNPELELAFRDTLICSKDTLQLNAILPGDYSWTPGINIINANSGLPLVFPKESITYYVSFNNNNCFGYDSVKVNVLDLITVDAGFDTTICRGDEIMLHPVSDATKYLWSPAVYFNNASEKNPQAHLTDSVTILKIFASLGNCTATDSLTIITNPYPVVHAGQDTLICFGRSVLLKGITNAPQFHWSPENRVENSTMLQTHGFPYNSMQFILTGNNVSGCVKPVSDTVVVTVIPPVKVFAGNDTTLVIDQPLQLNGNTTGTNYRWSQGAGISNPDILNPIVLISPDLARNAGEYIRFTLTASIAEGCNSSDEIVIRLFKSNPSIFVPTGFTPNGDGRNDILRPVLAGISTLQHFRIYNRYGNLIYETKTAGQGWNGTINGQPQPTGSFVYECIAIDFKGEQIKTKGSFVLVR